MSECYHWSTEYRTTSPLSKKEKGDLGERYIIRTLLSLKRELDLLAEEPVKLAHLKETDDIPDIYVEGYYRGFLIEVKNWWAPAKYDLATVRANVDKDWASIEYPVRMSGGQWYGRSTITMKNEMPAVPILVVTQLNSWRQNAQNYVRQKFGNDLILTDHPMIPNLTSLDSDCILETGQTMFARLQKAILRGDRA